MIVGPAHRPWWTILLAVLLLVPVFAGFSAAFFESANPPLDLAPAWLRPVNAVVLLCSILLCGLVPFVGGQWLRRPAWPVLCLLTWIGVYGSWGSQIMMRFVPEGYHTHEALAVIVTLLGVGVLMGLVVTGAAVVGTITGLRQQPDPSPEVP